MINNPYQTTPMMNNNYMPMQNPYADRMNFLQNYQQSLQQPVAGTQMSLANQQPMPQQIAGINGRIVQAVEDINANEVPMDGSMAFFPKQDMSKIYVKGWNADGTIRTIVYLSNALRGFMQRKVLIHEVCHAICMSYDVYLPIEQEEILCDFVATYGDEVFDIVDMVLGAVRRVG